MCLHLGHSLTTIQKGIVPRSVRLCRRTRSCAREDNIRTIVTKAFSTGADNDRANGDAAAPYRTFATNRRKFSHRDLPEETLYIFDGTAMLFLSHYSRLNQNEHSGAALSAELSASVIEDWGLLADDNYVVDSNKSSGVGGSVGGGDDDTVEDPIERISHPVTIREDGVPVVNCGALTTMIYSFARFIRDINPRYVAVAFDSGRETFRKKLYPQYKEHRSEVGEVRVELRLTMQCSALCCALRSAVLCASRFALCCALCCATIVFCSASPHTVLCPDAAL
jgi:5'-3' exonuclease, N-terminal resolvase-like domain